MGKGARNKHDSMETCFNDSPLKDPPACGRETINKCNSGYNCYQHFCAGLHSALVTVRQALWHGAYNLKQLHANSLETRKFFVNYFKSVYLLATAYMLSLITQSQPLGYDQGQPHKDLQALATLPPMLYVACCCSWSS